MTENSELVPLPERTVYVTRLHWRTLAQGLAVIAVATALWMLPLEWLRVWTTIPFSIIDGSGLTLTIEIVRAVALSLLGIGLCITFANVAVLGAARFIVTDRRVILRTGALKRRSFELPLDRVEAITVSQSMIGRLLDYGTLVVAGIGSTREIVSFLSRPNEFRRHVIDQTEQRRVA